MKVFLLLSLVLDLGCVSDPIPKSNEGSLDAHHDLPPALGVDAGRIYPFTQEQNPQAKADGLVVETSNQEAFGLTEPPDEQVELLPEWAETHAVLIAWHEPLAGYFEALVDALVGISSV